MTKEPRFYICKKCGNMVNMLHESGAPMTCCGENMSLITANTTDASQEKHVPVVTVDGDTVFVQVGSVAHPMTEEHKIVWIYLQTAIGEQLNCIDTSGKPETSFKIRSDDKVIAVYEYCNLHGLWKTDMK